METTELTDMNPWISFKGGKEIQILKIIGMDGVDFGLRPSLNICAQRHNGAIIYELSIGSHMEKTQSRSNVVEPKNLNFSVEEGLSISIKDARRDGVKEKFKVGLMYRVIEY